MSEQEMTNEERHQQYREQSGNTPSTANSVTITHDTMKKVVIVAVCAVVVVFIAGNILTTLAANAADSNEAGYIEAMRRVNPTETELTDEQLVDGAYAFCDAMDRGVSVDDAMLEGAVEVDRVARVDPPTAFRLSGLVARGGVAWFCPEHQATTDAWMNS